MTYDARLHRPIEEVLRLAVENYKRGELKQRQNLTTLHAIMLIWWRPMTQSRGAQGRLRALIL
jgi:hypothetical protein